MAPTITPGMLPIPPRMITASTLIETMSLKLFGNTEPIFAAKKAPPRQAIPAPMAKARSLYLITLIPMASATDSSSRIAAHALPTRELTRR
jgi:hypothetical protein